jgi:hypothetical protein
MKKKDLYSAGTGQTQGPYNYGRTWEKIPINIEPENYLQPFDYNMAIVRFYNENEGEIFLYQVKPAAGWVNIRTGDKGRTWASTAVPGGNGYIYLSYDGKYLSIAEFTNNLLLLKRKN